jgi:transposase InsO family protein
METVRKVNKQKYKDPLYARRKGSGNYRKHYPFEFKLKCVKLYLEEGFPSSLIEQEVGVNRNNIHRWVNSYREQGEAGLKHFAYRRFGKKLKPSVRKKIVELKKQDSKRGIRRISDILRRIFFLQASPETVRRTLHEEKLIEKPKQKPKRNISKPRFFERSTPNQLWQSDIFMFRLGGKYAYLIAYLDDYSRYITGIGLFRSQTAEHVIEVYRTAVAEYNPPREMLTDNGRQYTNWRSTSRFEAELNKDKVKHIRSQPHHPMTLGKVERFWKSIYEEFLCRAQFDSFEEARERIIQWISYYNHKRPHQGIGGLCPADRYFEIATELKKAIQDGIKENVLETALRGQPRSPFYMVGRMDGQSVVLKAEKGKLKLSVDDPEEKNKRELTYDLHKGGDENGKEENDIKAPGYDSTEQEKPVIELQCDRESKSGSFNMDREQETVRGVQGAADQVRDTQLLAEQGHGGDAAGAGTQGEPGERPGFVNPAPEVPGQEGACTEEYRHKLNQADREASENPEIPNAKECIFNQEMNPERRLVEGDREERSGFSVPQADRDNTEGSVRRDNSHRGSQTVGYFEKVILPMGKKRPGRYDEIPGRELTGPAGERNGSGEGKADEREPGAETGTGDRQEISSGKEAFPRLGSSEGQR